MTKPTVAVIGTGAAGMACGHFLHKDYQLTFFEQNDYIGGHANTAIIQGDAETVHTDTAFIIFNDENYPLFSRMLHELEVETLQCPMGFSIKILSNGWEYNTRGLSWTPTNLLQLFDWRFVKMLRETGRFYRQALEIYTEQKYHEYSIADYLKEKDYSDDFLHHYLIPILAVVWSIPPKDMLDYPALTMIEFLKNHGAFQGLTGRKRWSTVKKGSGSYRDKIIQPFKDQIEVGNAATQVTRNNGRAQVTDSRGKCREFDHLILAAHADQSLRLLADPSAQERTLLSNFRYSKNTVTLHTDKSLLPKRRYMWAGWNYLVEQKQGETASSFTYYMNDLQQVSKKTDYFVTVNDTGRINAENIIREYDYEHPIFDLPVIKAQPHLHELNENGVTFFCGSYFKYGFHEDAFRSGVEVCRKLTGKKIWE